MPFEMVDHKGLSSSSFFSEDVHFPNEQRQVGFWKTETKPESYGVNPVDSPTMESQIAKNFKINGSHSIHNQKVSGSLEKYAVGAERATNYSLGRSLENSSGKRSSLNLDSISYSRVADGINLMGSQYENSLFSSSVSDIFSRKSSDYVGDESLETLKEIEAKTIGNLLPSDDDFLSGVMDGLDLLGQPNLKEDNDDFDLFSSVGGLDLGEDGFSGKQDSVNAFVGEKSHGEHLSRTLFVQNIDSSVEDSELRTLFELYGDIHTLYTAYKQRGLVVISYYDIRAAQNALRALQGKPLRRRKLEIHFSIPKDNFSEQDINQGTLAVFNIDPSVSNEELYHIFAAYGAIKDIRDTMQGVHKKIVEFYDLRSAEAALRALNRSEIAGKQIKIEAGCPSAAKWSGSGPFSEIGINESVINLHQVRSPNNSTPGFFGPISHGGISSSSMINGFHHGISSSVPNDLPSLLRAQSLANSSSALPGHSPSMSQGGQLSLGFQASPLFHPHSLNDNHQFHRVGNNVHPHELDDTIISGNGSCPSPAHHYIWNNTPQCAQPPQSMMWPNSSNFVNNNIHAIPRAPSHMLNTILPINNHHVGSAPSMNPSLWDRRHSGSSPRHHSEFLYSRVGGNLMDMKNMALHQRCMMLSGRGGGQMIPMLSSSFESPNERSRNRRNEGNSNQGENKKQFELDLDRIMRGEDKRTTLMIKNIPNKYTSKMLLAAIDDRHRGTYDFFYLPIDFKNKCNVGYAFINMTEPSVIIPFYQAFNGKKWEKFNSEKVAVLAYARIQGKAALIAHFQNSSLMNEDKRCRPILFNTEGPNTGDQVPFPVGVNIRPRPSKTRASTSDGNYLDNGMYMSTTEELTYEDSTSIKDSD